MQKFFCIARHVALIALIARALVPAGWMPGAHGMTICSVQTPGIATLGRIHHDGKHDSSNQECPFAAAAHMAAAPEAPSLATPTAHAIAAAANRTYAAAIIAHFTPQSPRAPPQTV